MNDKMKSCCTPHVFMHSLFGLGVGVLLATLVEGARLVWLGIALMAVAFVADAMRKKCCDCEACCTDECKTEECKDDGKKKDKCC